MARPFVQGHTSSKMQSWAKNPRWIDFRSCVLDTPLKFSLPLREMILRCDREKQGEIRGSRRERLGKQTR